MNTKALSYFTTFAVIAAIAGIALNALTTALFVIAVSALFVLIAVTDYSTSATRWSTLAHTRRERNALAA